jgi:two-component system, OmpR family, phosphate regulon sensor histidine kinase PhoR
MKNKHLRVIIFGGALVMAALFLVQIYWFHRAFDVSERQMDHTIQVALKRVADSVSNDSEVRKLSSNFFFVETNSPLSDEEIDSLLKKELNFRKLSIDYEVGIYKAADDTLVYGNYVPATRGDENLSASPGVLNAEIKNFAVYFPGKRSYLTSQLGIWIFSTVIFLIMMGLFTYAIIVLLRERRFAELKNDFINNMTHEFKTPVTNIQLAGEILRSRIEDRELTQYLDILVKENNKLKTKIDQVLLGSSAEYRMKSSFARIDVHQLLQECSEAFEFKVRERQGTLQLVLNATDSVILGDRELLATAISNVIDNAEKYSRGRPHIVVRTKDIQQNRISIEIADNGIGIEPSFVKNVFRKFFRVPSGDLHNVKGFGLGLNFVEQVIRSHTGQVTLVSAISKGTEVRILLPRS